MKKILYFLMVGLAFTALQVVTVGAQTGDPSCAPTASGTLPPHCTGGQGDPNMTPPTGVTGGPPMGDTANAPKVGLGQRIKNLFGMGAKDVAPPTGAPGTAPMGDPNMAPPTGASGTAPMGNISHCAEFSGPPKVACEAAAAGN